eukprot:CAMPEP_0185531096 /NCGR_PEP_ID=MMETSP1366-20130426/105709_1 /TAXON_ID=38817 /ORGANISM="Gephyrocapsa oceanica, Strain RCC1303" /LENGTH=116 /DNA_ID=CAMNT_0028142793 /DNA_START=154 /DNA_END=502 /DNA_ORIENTATION=-
MALLPPWIQTITGSTPVTDGVTMLRLRQSSPTRPEASSSLTFAFPKCFANPWISAVASRQASPYVVQSSGSVHGARGCGPIQRFVPAVEAEMVGRGSAPLCLHLRRGSAESRAQAL